MISKRLFNYDDVSGMSTFIFFDEETEKTWFGYEQDQQDHFDYAAESRANNNLNKSKDMWHAAHISPLMIMKLKNEHGVDIYNPAHKDKLRKILNSSDFLKLRTNEFVI